jgi:glutamate dehydrogenase/leucine dehydrogenase
VVIRQDPDTGLRFIVAVHSTVLGPALGGLRLKVYPGGLYDALEDVLGLARTMTLKASAAGLDIGGGKAVMLDDGCSSHRRARMEGAARVIDELGGAYITAEDIGTTCEDMDTISRHTRFVTGRSLENCGRGDPSPVTAETVFRAMLRALESEDLDGRTVGVIGLGKVGGRLAVKLHEAGARVLATDIDPARVEQLADEGAVEPMPSADSVLAAELDVLAPCAAGGLITDTVASALTARVICGAANNPLSGTSAARALAARGVLYVPDFLAKCGGLISVEAEWRGAGEERVEAGIARAMDRLDAALAESARTGTPPSEVAERQALERVERARHTHGHTLQAA